MKSTTFQPADRAAQRPTARAAEGVMWDICRRTAPTLAAVALLLASSQASAEARWRPIFDGKTLKGWTPKIVGHPAGVNFQNTFIVKDGAIRVSYADYDRFGSRFGLLFYKTPLTAYRLRFNYRVLDPSLPDTPAWARNNSGVMFHSQSPESMTLNQAFPVSVEFQILGADGPNPRPTGAVCTPGVSITIDGKRQAIHCSNSSGPTIPNGTWTALELEVLPDGRITETINGAVVHRYADVTLDAADPMAAADARRLIAERGCVLPVRAGYIALQSEGHPIEFKDIAVQMIRAAKPDRRP